MNLRNLFALGSLAVSLAVPAVASAQSYYPAPAYQPAYQARPVYGQPVYGQGVNPYQARPVYRPVYQTAPVTGVPVYGGYNPYQGPAYRGGWDRDRGREGGWGREGGHEGGWGREGGWRR